MGKGKTIITILCDDGIRYASKIFNKEFLKSKNLPILNKKSISYKKKRESIIDNLANEFDKHLNLTSFLSWKKQILKYLSEN